MKTLRTLCPSLLMAQTRKFSYHESGTRNSGKAKILGRNNKRKFNRKNFKIQYSDLKSKLHKCRMKEPWLSCRFNLHMLKVRSDSEKM